MVQLLEYFMWVDIDCKNGLNNTSTILMPLIVYSQPVIYYGLLNYFASNKSNNTIDNNILLVCNIAYMLFLLYRYNNLKRTCTTVNDENHLSWGFENFDIGILYLIMMILNSVNHLDNLNVKTMLIVTSSLLLISNLYTKKNLGEIWCFISTGTPLVVLLSQYLMK
jgi:hypothetical protein